MWDTARSGADPDLDFTHRADGVVENVLLHKSGLLAGLARIA